MPNTHERGRRFEDLVVRHLIERGWDIVDRNVRHGRNEIDLVIARGDVVAFVEVKGRSGPAFGHPLHAITRRKRGRIADVARWWILQFGERGRTYRFDAAAVEEIEGRITVLHVEDAWRLG
jgi:putative endonuclease